MTIPQSFIQELLARVDVVDIVGRYVPLKKGGANFMGLCPFHGEKSPSFSVSPSKQFYHCFGCGKNGNAIGFLMEHAGMGFVEAVQDLAQQVGLGERLDHRPFQLSGGQQQRVAIARALMNDPAIIMADEPTGNLDSHNANVVMDILKKTNKEQGTTIALVTHEPEFAAMASREIFLVDGVISADKMQKQ